MEDYSNQIDKTISHDIVNYFFTNWLDKKNSEDAQKYFEVLFWSTMEGRRIGVLEVKNQKVKEVYLINKTEKNKIHTRDQQNRECDFELDIKKSIIHSKFPHEQGVRYTFTVISNM